MLEITTLEGDLIFASWRPDTPATEVRPCVAAAYRELAARLGSAAILQERIFGDLGTAAGALAGRREGLRDAVDAPLAPTFIDGRAVGGGAVAGIHLLAVDHGRAGTTLTREGRPAGRVVHGREADYLALSDVAHLLPATPGRCRDEETAAAIQAADAVLTEAGWSFGDVLRTWFYLDDILAWYDDFNAARNRIYQNLGVLNGSAAHRLPASTGIHGRSPLGHACTLDLLAVRPVAGAAFAVERLFNPRQNEAPQYGSAFSRGLALTTGSRQTLWISGTAAIDDDGVSLFARDFVHQAEQTLDTVACLLETRGADLADIVQATAFIKHASDGAALEAILRARGLTEAAIVTTIADVCRDELLFELDATAVLPAG